MAKKKTGKEAAANDDTEVQERLPEMQDPAIEELEKAARGYAKIRDRRQALTDQEVDAKMLLGTIMKKNSKTSYHHAGVSIEIVPEGEKIKVRISDPDE